MVGGVAGCLCHGTLLLLYHFGLWFVLFAYLSAIPVLWQNAIWKQQTLAGTRTVHYMGVHLGATWRVQLNCNSSSCVSGGRRSRVRKEWNGEHWNTRVRCSRMRTSGCRRASSSTTTVGQWSWAIRPRKWPASTHACSTTSTPLETSSIATLWRTGERYAARFKKP